MAKAFSVASWNVEHFKSQGVSSRVEDVVEFLAEQRPDVFALYEVEGKEVFDALTTLMPEYTFHITEGQQVQQILLGVGRASRRSSPRRPSSGPASRCFARARY